MDELVSIIIPVFNVENYLAQCLDSVLAQTYQHLEIIVVNDGSYDGSGRICREYAMQDSRIKVHNQPNQGLAAARNAGLNVATGEYVTFIDADDFIVPDYVSHLAAQIQRQRAEIVIGGQYVLDEASGNFLIYYNEQNYQVYLPTKVTLLAKLTESRFITVWGELFHRSLFDHLRFPDGRYHEDAFVIAKLYLKAKRIVVLDESLYCYRKRAGSISTRLRPLNQIQDDLDAGNQMIVDVMLHQYDPQPIIERQAGLLRYYRWDLEQRGMENSSLYQRILSEQQSIEDYRSGKAERGEN